MTDTNPTPDNSDDQYGQPLSPAAGDSAPASVLPGASQPDTPRTGISQSGETHAGSSADTAQNFAETAPEVSQPQAWPPAACQQPSGDQNAGNQQPGQEKWAQTQAFPPQAPFSAQQPTPEQQRPSAAPAKNNRRKGVTLPVWLFVLLLVVAVILGAVPGTISAISSHNSYRHLAARYELMTDKYQTLKHNAEQLEEDQSDSDSSDDSDDSLSTNDVKTGKIGDTLTSGGIEMKLESVDYPSSIKTNGEYDDDPGQLTPKSGNKFVAVHTTVKNNGKASVDFTCDYVIAIKAINDKGQQYDEIDNEDYIPGNPGCNAGLQPGMSENMEFVFEVPQSANILGIAWQDESDDDNEGPVRVFKF